jgi:two-component system LytT family response regulator
MKFDVMKPQKIVIIDDSLTATNELKEEIARFEHLKVIGQAQTKEKAIKILKNETPDIVFLDVQLELDHITGFDLLKELKELKLLNFIVIFYTAYEKYAVNAIRASAFDFLLKPLDPIQLSIVISRIQNNSDLKTNTNVEKLIDQLTSSSKIALQTNTGLRFVKLQSIVFVRLDKSSVYRNGHISVYLVDGEKINLMPSITLKKIRTVLQEDSFFEISRQTIINLHYLNEIENGTDNRCVMCQPYSEVQLKISRNQMCKLRRNFCLV